MKFSNKALSQTITQLCFSKGIDHIVISPGSRNAPLIIGFTGRPEFKNFSIVDERCAAFFALGIAQQIKRPVCLVCTSGSALLNYYPAIAEAYYSNIPLIVISADRPKSFIDIGDGQTIRQELVFANHICYSANCREGEAQQIYNEIVINSALNTAIELQGPVHINVPFSEPLYLTSEIPSVRPQDVPARTFSEKIEDKLLNSFQKQWNESEKKIILIGVLSPNSIEQKWIDQLAADESVLVLTETLSNLHHPEFFPGIDQLIAPLEEEELKKLQPDLLLTLGGLVVSKKVKAFLRKFPPKVHWHVDSGWSLDTFFVLSHHVKSAAGLFLQEFLPNISPKSSAYKPYWLRVKAHRLKQHRIFLPQAPFSDHKVFGMLSPSLPEDCQLQLSNSATVRYSQLFEIHPSIAVYCNRGTSGIDGSTSTAIGAAYASDKQTILITGDLSFFYDSNALWNDHIPKNFRIICINNRGGGIFRILPGTKEIAHFSRFFETTHQLTAAQLCEMYRIGYQTASEEAGLQEILKSFYKASERPKLLEIFTPSEINDTVLQDYFNFLK